MAADRPGIFRPLPTHVESMNKEQLNTLSELEQKVDELRGYL